MKNKALLLFLALISSVNLVLGSEIQTTSSLNQDPGDVVVIPMKPIITNPSGGPKSPSLNLFTAHYDPYSNFISIHSLSSCGDSFLTVVSTAGDFYQTIFDTEDGSILIPISGNTGHYTISIITTSGQAFEGEFNI